MGNLFSSFDPNSRIFTIKIRYNWIAALGGLIILPQGFWLRGNQVIQTIKTILNLLIAELLAVFGRFAIPGTTLVFLGYFFFILGANFIGLFPFIFTPSRHLVFTLSLSLPLWLGSIIWARLFQFNRVIAHLVPLGTPAALIPVIVIIETVSSIIRPATLAVRLAANMIAGHLLLALLGGQGSLSLRGATRLLAVFLILLIILERAVACIQSYVFTILSSLYLNELMRNEFTKKFL